VGGSDAQRWSMGATFMRRYNGRGLSAEFLPRVGRPGGVTERDSLFMLKGSETSDADGECRDAVDTELNDVTEREFVW